MRGRNSSLAEEEQVCVRKDVIAVTNLISIYMTTNRQQEWERFRENATPLNRMSIIKIENLLISIN